MPLDRLADLRGVRHRRGLEHEVRVPLGHLDRLVDVEVAAHVAEDDRRLRTGLGRLRDRERRRQRLVAAVEERRRVVRGRDADQPQRVLAGRVRDRRHRVELQALEAELGDRPLEQRNRLVAVPGMDAGERLEPAGVGARRRRRSARARRGFTSGASTIVITTPLRRCRPRPCRRMHSAASSFQPSAGMSSTCM